MSGSENPGVTGRGGRAATWALLAALTGCQDCEPVGLVGGKNADTPEQVCVLREHTCGAGEAFRDGQCRPSACATDADCCPSTRCDHGFGMCRSRLLDVECVADADCPRAGQRCTGRRRTP